MAKAYGITDCQRIAQDRNGQCMSRTFTGYYAALEWMCNKHKIVWSCSLDQIFKGNWCEQCKIERTRTKIKTYEDLCREAFKNLTERDFVKTSPRWLYGLTLDGYNEDIQIAFICHDKDTNVDHIIEHCCKNNVTLIPIPNWVKNLEDYITDKLEE